MENQENISIKTNKETTTKTNKIEDLKNQKNKDNKEQKTARTELSNIQKNANSDKNNENLNLKQQKSNNFLQNNNLKQSSNKNKNKPKNWLLLLIFIGSPIIVGLLSSLLGGKMREDYIKPPAYPPDLLFTIMWCVLYIAIGIAAYLAYKSQKDNLKRKKDIIWFAIHLFFNLFWTLIFFRFDMLILATIWLLAMIVTAIGLTYRYFRCNLASGIIFTGYSLWLIFAMYLTLAITLLNVTGAV